MKELRGFALEKKDVEEILEKRADLPLSTKQALLLNVAELEEDNPGSMDPFLEVLRSGDADFIKEAVQIAQDCHINPDVIIVHYPHKVEESLKDHNFPQ